MIQKMTVTTWILWFLILAALAFGFWGWSVVAITNGLTFGDVIYRTITTLPVSTTLNSSQNWNNQWQIDVARWLGLAVFLLGVFKVVVILLSRQLKHLQARFRKNHFIIFGEHPFAKALTDAAIERKKETTWLGASEVQAEQENKLLFVKAGTWNYPEAKKYGINDAKSVVITSRDDATAIAIARQVRSKIPHSSSVEINVIARSPWLAMRLDDIKNIKLISLAQTAIRQIHRKHPPFLFAQRHNQSRIHTVIIGFGLFGEAILIDTLLSCLTTYLEKPLFTIIDPRAEMIKSSLELRYPELSKCADINFVPKMIEGDNNSLCEKDILDISNKCPVTLAYICMHEEEKALSNALALQALAHRHDWMGGAIFVRLSTLGAIPKAQAGVSDVTPARLISFGSLDDIVCDSGIFSDDADGLAKTMHRAYMNAAPDDKISNTPWEKLDEDKRDSNRRLIAHIAAKISSAGMDIEPWLKELDKNPEHPNLPHLKEHIDDQMIKELSALEHDRWMADRRLNGWRYGAERDDKKRIHPDLKPYDELTLEVQEYDKVMIETLFNILTKQKL